MGWEEDHRNAVADRWRRRYIASGMSADDFSEYMKKTLLHCGGSEEDISKMIKRAVKKGKQQ